MTNGLNPVQAVQTILGNQFYLPLGDSFGGVTQKHCSDLKLRDNFTAPVASRCLLIRYHENEVVKNFLINAGIGDVNALTDSTRREYYDVTQGHQLLASLREMNIMPSDINGVLLTDLHVGSAGGLLQSEGSGREARLAFPEARYWVGRKHWEHATSEDVGEWASERFIFSIRGKTPHIPSLIEKTGRLQLLDDSNPLMLGGKIFCHFLDGHTPGQILPEIICGGNRIVYGSDVFGFQCHLNKPKITTTSDCDPPVLTQEKRNLLERFAEEGVYVCLGHDMHIAAARVERDYLENGRNVFKAVDLLTEVVWENLSPS